MRWRYRHGIGGWPNRGHSLREQSRAKWGDSSEEKSRSRRMKLNSTQVQKTLQQFEAQVLPDNHPAVSQLNSLFGEHTFFLDNSGLKVLEPADTPDMKAHTGEIVSLADWSDETLTSLRPHEPELTGVVVVLEPTQ
jgi:hypothetical protein